MVLECRELSRVRAHSVVLKPPMKLTLEKPALIV